MSKLYDYTTDYYKDYAGLQNNINLTRDEIDMFNYLNTTCYGDVLVIDSEEKAKKLLSILEQAESV